MCDQTTNTTNQIKAGKIKAYAVTTPERLAVAARRADRRRGRPAGLRVRHLARPLRAEGHAGRGHRPPDAVAADGAEGPERGRALRRARHGAVVRAEATPAALKAKLEAEIARGSRSSSAGVRRLRRLSAGASTPLREGASGVAMATRGGSPIGPVWRRRSAGRRHLRLSGCSSRSRPASATRSAPRSAWGRAISRSCSPACWCSSGSAIAVCRPFVAEGEPIGPVAVARACCFILPAPVVLRADHPRPRPCAVRCSSSALVSCLSPSAA